MKEELLSELYEEENMIYSILEKKENITKQNTRDMIFYFNLLIETKKKIKQLEV